MRDEELCWCHGCYRWQPWKHEPLRPPWRVRIRRAVGSRLVDIGEWLVGDLTDPAFPPPAGYRQRGSFADRISP